jgi:hypothetical protein
MPNTKKPKLEAIEDLPADQPTAIPSGTSFISSTVGPPMIADVPDPFDLASLRLDQNFTETVGVKKLLKTLPVRKPGKQDFIRVHPDPAYRDNVALIDYKADREVYIVTPAVARELPNEIIPVTLYLAVDRQGVLFLWPIRLPDADGRDLDWYRSAREAADIGTTNWVRVTANMKAGAYDIFVAEGVTAEPTWPELPLQELIRIAFKDRLITSLNHRIVQRLLHGV